MRYWTWGELSRKIKADTSTEDEIFVTPEELLGYANEAIDDIEKKIHTLCEDYFVSRTTIPVTPGEEEIPLPSDIYAMKVREVIYVYNNQSFEVRHLKNWKRFAKYETNKAMNIAGTNSYHYFLINQTAGSPKLILTPTPSQSGVLKLWYLRNASQLVDETSILDIPEAASYVLKYCKVCIMKKELNPLLETAKMELENTLRDIIAELSEMFPNNENEIEADYSHYDDMV